MCWHPSMTTLILILALFQTAQDLYNSAATDFEAGRWAEAAMKYESVLKEDASHIPSRFNLAMFYMRGNEIDKAYPHLIAVQAKGLGTAELYVALSEAEHGRQNEAKSREYLEKAISLDSKNTNLRRQLAISYFTDKDYAKAIPPLVELVRLEPTNADYLYLLGKSYEKVKA